MALWQYTFQVLPYEGAKKLSPDLIFNGSITELDTESFWRLCPFKKDCFSELSQVLEKTLSWSEEIDLYGKIESNCFEILFDSDSNEVISASFRIDFTTDYELVLRAIIEFCILNDFIVLDENINNVILNYDIISSLIANSPQVKNYKLLSKSK